MNKENKIQNEENTTHTVVLSPIDVFICGSCYLAFNNLRYYLQHKKKNCEKGLPSLWKLLFGEQPLRTDKTTASETAPGTGTAEHNYKSLFESDDNDEDAPKLIKKMGNVHNHLEKLAATTIAHSSVYSPVTKKMKPLPTVTKLCEKADKPDDNTNCVSEVRVFSSTVLSKNKTNKTSITYEEKKPQKRKILANKVTTPKKSMHISPVFCVPTLENTKVDTVQTKSTTPANINSVNNMLFEEKAPCNTSDAKNVKNTPEPIFQGDQTALTDKPKTNDNNVVMLLDGANGLNMPEQLFEYEPSKLPEANEGESFEEFFNLTGHFWLPENN